MVVCIENSEYIGIHTLDKVYEADCHTALNASWLATDLCKYGYIDLSNYEYTSKSLGKE